MLNFELMLVDGFASIHKEVFNWDSEGLNIIQAPNGYGKSKFIDALCWCLYGKSLSGSIEPWEHKKHKKFKGTKVEISFKSDGINYKVIRCKDFKGDILGAKGNSRLILLVEGIWVSEKKKEKIQVEIINTLGYSFDLFKNSIIFGQKIKRLITETGPNKKKIFEEAFEMSYIPQAKALVEKDKKEIELSYYKQSSKVSGLKDNLETKKEALKSEKMMMSSFDGDKISEINRETELILNCNLTIASLTIPKEKAERLNSLYLKADKELRGLNETQLNKNIGKAESLVERLFDSIGDLEGLILLSGDSSEDGLLEACPHCNRSYTTKDKKEEAKRKKDHSKKLVDDLKDLKDKYDIATGSLKQLELDASSIISIKKSIESYKSQLEILETLNNVELDIKSHEEKIEKIKQKSLKNSTKKYIRDIRLLKKQLKPEKKLLVKLKTDLEIKKWLIDDPLSNNGLKAFIFNKMMDKLNEKLSYYSKFIPFKVLFDLDMDSHHKNIDTYVLDGDNPVPFEDLSGGQQQAVNIATAFAIHDVVSDGKDCNLLIMDELFESLDKDNIEIMSELIQDKAIGKSLFLITHRSEFNPTNAKIININYKDGFSSVG